MLSRWLDRPGYLVAAAFVAGAAVAAIVAIVVFVRNGGDGGSAPVVATPTALPGTPGTPAAGGGTPVPSATGTLRVVSDPDQALIDFVRDQLHQTYVGACPPQPVPNSTPAPGVCSAELYRSDTLVTFSLGYPSSEGFGELVFLHTAAGAWTLDFVEAPPLAESTPVVGRDAVVMNAGDCLRFREAPGTSAKEVTCQIDGTRAKVLEGPVRANEQDWWHLQGFGWATGAYLVRAAN